jgi:hypothetical protein
VSVRYVTLYKNTQSIKLDQVVILQSHEPTNHFVKGEMYDKKHSFQTWTHENFH